MSAFADEHALRRDLLAAVRERGGARDEAVAEALLAVPRHVFLPGVALEEVYSDDAIVTKRDDAGVPISSSSQPTIMALMLDQLGVAPGHRVLEIGSGTGYNAALLARLVGQTGEVVSMDIAQDVVDGARQGLSVAGYDQVTVVCDDGAHGYPPGAPYDRIIATVGVWDLAPAWLDQLAPGGRIVVPLDLHGTQVSVAFERQDGGWVSRSQVPCGFMQLQGELAGPGQTHVLDRSAGMLALSVPEAREVDIDGLRTNLAGPAVIHPTGVRVRNDLAGTVALWLAVTEPRSCGLAVDGGERLPLELALMQASRFRATPGIVADDRIALLVGRPVDDLLVLEAHGYGYRGWELASDLAAHVRAWDAAGRPTAAGLRVTAYPIGEAPVGEGIVITKAHTRIVIQVRPA